MRTQLLALLLVIIAIPASSSELESFAFWPGKGAEQATGFERIEGHPCGEVTYARVAKLPTTKKGPLIPEIVVEFDLRGDVIRRWPMPVDYVPHALKSEELLVMRAEKGFWIRTNGSFLRAAPVSLPSSEQTADRCDLQAVFGN